MAGEGAGPMRRIGSLRPQTARKRRYPLSLRFKLAATGLVGVALTAVVMQAALVGLGRVERSSRVVGQVSQAQAYHQDARIVRNALRMGVLESQLSAIGRTPATKEEILTDLAEKSQRFRRDLAGIESIGFGGALGSMLDHDRTIANKYISDAELLARLAFTDPAAFAREDVSFERSFDAVERSQANVTAELRQTADLAQQRATREQDAARARIVAASGTALLGLLLLALMLSRLGGRLAAVMDELRSGVGRQRFGAQLTEALEMVEGEADAYHIVERAMERVAPATPMELLLADSSEAQLERVASNPASGAPECPVESPWGCMAVRRGAAITFETSQALNACPKLDGRPAGPMSAVCVPVTFMGRSLGVLHATGPDGQPPSQAEADQLVTLAGQAGTRLGTLRTFERTELQAATDALTGLMNRRTLENRVQAMIAARQPFALAMVDLDRFKRLNDTHGHAAGDHALRLFARTISSGIRDGDLFARYGGEEFVLVFPHLTVREAVEAIDRQRTLLAGAVAAAAGPGFTASFGVADSTSGATLDEILRAADGGLLQAKALGRDRVVAAGQAMPEEAPALAGDYGRSSGMTTSSTTDTT